MAGNGPHRRTITIVNPLGFHYRPAQIFFESARKFQSRVTVWNGSIRADGSSLMELIMLMALPGAELVLEVEGPDSEEAMATLGALLASPGDSIE